MSVTGPQFDAQSTPAETDTSDADLLEKFERWDKALTAHWSLWRQDAEAEYEFRDGRQWSPDDVAAMEDNGKIAVTFNLVSPTLDAVSGAEISNRQQVQYFPRQVESTGIADALTQGAEYVSDECNGDQEDSEAFRDCITCGCGWTETRPDVDGQDVTLVKERVDPLQLRVDPASRKACFEDARYLCRDIPMSTDEFDELKEEIGKPDADGDDAGLSVGKRLTVVNPRQRYTNGMLGNGQASEDEVIVHEWQWWEKEDVHLTAMPDPQNPGVTKITPLSAADHTKAQKVVKDAGQPPLRSVKSTTKVYYRALVGGGDILHQEELKEGAFRYKAMTGKRDRKRGTWFGLMRPMMDPQKFTNKLFSEILHIVRTNANGGMAMEEGAVSDMADFENTWSATDKITWLNNGSLSSPNGPRMIPKTPPPVQPALFQLMELAMDMVRKVTGVNDEILGLVGKEQAGVLEYQRKQAAYGILSPFFDAERRYRRDQGKLLLAQMRLYLPADKLMKVVDQGTQQYVTVAETLLAAQYDVIVDDAPSGPNSKAKVMQILGPWMGPMVAGGILGPDAIADILPYMDLPSAVADKLANAIRGKMQMAQQVQQPIMEAEQAAKTKQAAATLDQTNADAEHKRAQAFKAVAASHISQVQLGKEFLVAEQQAQSTQDQQEPDAPQQAAAPGVPGPGAPQPS